MLRFFFILAFFATTQALYAQRLKDLNVNYMVRGYIYAASAINDTLSPGGFGGSDNLPRQFDSLVSFSQKGLFLKIDTVKRVPFATNYNGYTLYLVNNTDTIASFRASDSRLYVLAEAYVKNKWQPIEYAPSSWCGNSYHKVYLKPRQYWAFAVPVYDGKIKTRIRYSLYLNGMKTYIYSNEIEAGINKEQLEMKQGHKRQGLMDPYNE